ncbi:hypothetical protein [Brevundimonas sp. FT23028]|uniref:hypothetical protein n=1 Tax=Brevundimonas sp. FT23028 TaxID=3393748 RepID=UPI003B58B159
MLNRTISGVIALAAVSGLNACEKGPEIVPAQFTARPSASDIAEVYPAFARMARIPGKVKMRCEYSISGTLQRCRQIAVAPEGLNFEAGVPRLLSKYTVAPQTLDGRPAPAPITFVISFNPPPAPGPYTGEPVREADVAVVRRSLSYMGEAENRAAQYRATRSVELDRMTTVGRIVDSAYAAEGAARRAVMPLAVVQTLLPADRRELSKPSGYVMFPTLYQLEAESPEFFAANERLASHMRNAYCAAWSCSTELPEAAPAGT